MRSRGLPFFDNITTKPQNYTHRQHHGFVVAQSSTVERYSSNSERINDQTRGRKESSSFFQVPAPRFCTSPSHANSFPHSKPAQFVTVIVSKAPTEQKFVVHKELICFHSPFFNAAFNGKFIEGQTQEMRMDDVDEETFGQLVHWL
jgi:hypothetical protein